MVYSGKVLHNVLEGDYLKPLFLHRPLSSLVDVATAQRNIPEYFLITLDEGIKAFSCFSGLTGNGVGVRKNLVGTLRLTKTAFYQFRLEFHSQFPSILVM